MNVFLVALVFLAAAPSRSFAPGGFDRDDHNCVHSAGYRWCEATQACVRPWETEEPSCKVKKEDLFASLRHGGMITGGLVREKLDGGDGDRDVVKSALASGKAAVDGLNLRHGGMVTGGLVEKVKGAAASAAALGAQQLPPSDMNGVFGILPGVLPVMLNQQGKPVQVEEEMEEEESLGSMVGGAGGIGPAWTYDPTMEAPAGEKDMGSWTSAVYTEEQQLRLGVDESGVKVEP